LRHRIIPWTEIIVLKAIENIEETKQSLERCRSCSFCSENEICDVAIADSAGLLHEYGRSQALLLITDGINRLWLRDEIKMKKPKRNKFGFFGRSKRGPSRRIITRP